MKMHKVIYHFKDGTSSYNDSVDNQMFPDDIADHLKNQLTKDDVYIITESHGSTPVKEIKSIEILL